MAFSWGAKLIGELGKLAEVSFDAARQAQANTPAAKRKANAAAQAREESCTPCAINAKMDSARQRAQALQKKTG